MHTPIGALSHILLSSPAWTPSCLPDNRAQSALPAERKGPDRSDQGMAENIIAGKKGESPKRMGSWNWGDHQSDAFSCQEVTVSSLWDYAHMLFGVSYCFIWAVVSHK